MPLCDWITGISCESDECLVIPAIYKKEMPVVGNKIIAIGKISKD